MIYREPCIPGGAGCWLLSEWLVSVSSQPRDKLTRNVQEPWAQQSQKLSRSASLGSIAASVYLFLVPDCHFTGSMTITARLIGQSWALETRYINTNFRKHEKMWKLKAIVWETSCLSMMTTTRSVLKTIKCLQFTKFDFICCVSVSLSSMTKKFHILFFAPSPAMVPHL